MRDDDLRNFFEEDAYNELLNVYAEEDAKKVHRAEPPKSVPSDTRRISVGRGQSSAAAPHTAQPIHQPTRHTPAQKPHVAKDVPIAPLTPAAPPKQFKLEIKDLDAEFNTEAEAEAEARARRAANAENARRHRAEQTQPGAFENFADVIKKRRFAQPAEEVPMVTEELSEAGEAVAAKSFPAKLDREAIRAFFIKNKKTWILILICIVASILLSTYTISCMNDVFAIRRDSETVVTVNIPADARTKDVLKILQKNDLIEHRHFCLLMSKILQFKDDNYLTGVYYVTPSMGFEKMLTTFKQPTTTGETVTLTFPEGFTVDQIIAKLEENKVCSAAVLYQTMQEVDFSSEFSFIAEMDNKEMRYRMLEGYMYPDTYEFYVGESPSSVLRKFLNNFNKRWTEEYAAQAQKLNMSVDDVITLASIIQKEAYGAEQSPLVSSVLHNRLNKSGLYPSLQCDSTTEYINEYIQKNTKSAVELARFTDRYSSYKCAGLPVGSICNPGDDAIKAALYPEKTDYYFFAHDTNKKLYLARNDNERRSNNLAILNANAEAEKKKNNG